MLIKSILIILLGQGAVVYAACPLYPPPCQQSAGVQGPCTSCCQALSSTNITYARISFDQQVADTPFYTTLFQDLDETRIIDNQCTTNFFINNFTYLLFRSTIRRDGIRTIERDFIQADPRFPGIYRLTGLTGDSGTTSQIDTGYVLGRIRPPCPPGYSFYQYNFRFDGISGCSGENGFSSLGFAVSSVPNTPAQCVDQARQLYISAGTPPANYIRAPNNLPYQCITRYLGRDCVNVNRVPLAYRSSLNSF